MKHFKVFVLVGLVTVFLISGMAFAQGGGQGTPPMMGCQQRFDSIDTDHNGQVSKEEFAAHTQEMFSKMDANGDGVLTKDELACCKGMGGGCMGKGMGHGMGQQHHHGQTQGSTQ